MKKILYLFIMMGLMSSLPVHAQDPKPLNLKEILHLADSNNALLKAEKLRVKQTQSLEKTAYDFDKTEIYFNKDENNITPNDAVLRVWGIQQTVAFPTVYSHRKKLRQSEIKLTQGRLLNTQLRLERDITMKYYQYQTMAEKVRIYHRIDSIYRQFSISAHRKFELGESNYLEKITASAKHKQIQLQLQEVQTEKIKLQLEINSLVQSQEYFDIAIEKPEQLTLPLPQEPSIRGVNLLEEKEKLAQAEWALERQKALPDITLNAFTGTGFQSNERYNGFQIGLQLPLFFWGNSSRIQAAKIQQEVARNETLNNARSLHNRIHALRQNLQQQQKALHYYQTEGNHLSEEILKMGQKSFQYGEIDYFQYIQILENGYQFKIEYLESLQNYNQTLLQLFYFMYED